MSDNYYININVYMQQSTYPQCPLPPPPEPDPALLRQQLQQAITAYRAAYRRHEEINQKWQQTPLYTDGVINTTGERPTPDWSGVVVPYPYDDDEQPATQLSADATQQRRWLR